MLERISDACKALVITLLVSAIIGFQDLPVLLVAILVFVGITSDNISVIMKILKKKKKNEKNG